MTTSSSLGPHDTDHPYWAHAQSSAAEAFRDLVDANLWDVPSGKSLEIESDSSSAVYFVVDGWLVVSKSTQEGHRQIIDFVLPGEVFDPGSADAGQSSADVAALTDAKLSVMSRAEWARLMQDHPDLQQIHNLRTAAGFSRIAERLLRLGKSQADTRIAYAICELCLRSSVQGPVDGNEFHLPLTQQVLGDFVGLSSVHVSRTFRRLRRRQIVGTGDHMDIAIHDVERLAEVAEIDLDDLRAEIIPAV